MANDDECCDLLSGFYAMPGRVLLALRHLISLALLWLTLGGISQAQSPAPAIVDFWTRDDTLLLEISLNAEALLSGVDPYAEPGFAAGRTYQTLRRLASPELEQRLKPFVKNWVGDLQVDLGTPVTLSYEGARIPVVGDETSVRISKLLLKTELPDGANTLQLTWPTGLGPVILRQQRVAAPYTGYLEPGDSSPRIPLKGGAALTAEQTIERYVPMGAQRLIPDGPGQVLIVLTLVFLGLSLRSLISQLLFLSLGVLVGMAAGQFDLTYVPANAMAQVTAMTVIVLALWNLILGQLHVLRLLAVTVAGALQGSGLGHDLVQIGLPPGHVAMAVLGFGAGFLLACIALAVAAFAASLVVAGRSYRLRARVSVFASILLAALGVYWAVAPVLLG